MGVTRKNGVMECEDPPPHPQKGEAGQLCKDNNSQAVSRVRATVKLGLQPCACSLGSPLGKGVLESRQLLLRLRAC